MPILPFSPSSPPILIHPSPSISLFLAVLSLSNTQASHALHFYPSTAEQLTDERRLNKATVQETVHEDRLTKQSPFHLESFQSEKLQSAEDLSPKSANVPTSGSSQSY